MKVSKTAFLPCTLTWLWQCLSSGYEYVSCESIGTPQFSSHEANCCQPALLAPQSHQPCSTVLVKECHCHALKCIKYFLPEILLSYVLCNSSLLRYLSERLINFFREVGMWVESHQWNITGHLGELTAEFSAWATACRVCLELNSPNPNICICGCKAM